MKAAMPEKNTTDELEKELAYCNALEKCIQADHRKHADAGRVGHLYRNFKRIIKLIG